MTIDIAKRRRVMERSMRLGHCICEPRRACPCEVFREQQLCPCAGERPEAGDLSQIKLTRLVRNAGCASKIPPADLEAVLGRLPEVNDPAVLSGLAAADDAAIYRIAENLCLVQTVDVFTPCVDDPYLFGRICAANCLSDIYAMGGQPRTALSILAFPTETLPGEIMYQMLAGAMETLAQAGVALVGGHSIKDEEIKLGFAVTGVIEPAVASVLESPRAGDVLVLTKPLGTGVLAFAEQIGRGHAAGLAAASASMATLNQAAAEAMRAAGASACTDITGFGLLGHLLRLARQSKLAAEVYAGRLPAFPGALEALRAGVIPGAVERNHEFVAGELHVDPGVEEALVQLGCDAQTSGGLLIAIAPERVGRLEQELAGRGVAGFVIGRFNGRGQGRLRMRMAAEAERGRPSRSTHEGPTVAIGLEPAPAEIAPMPAQGSAEHNSMNTNPVASETHQPGCCAEFFEPKAAGVGSSAEAQKAFGSLMRAVQGPGALNEKAKELILFSLVVASRCQPCFDAHLHRARELGISQAELDEAAWCAIAMGGAPVRMFYQECLRRAEQASGVS